MVIATASASLAPGQTDPAPQTLADAEEHTLALYVRHSQVVHAPWPVTRVAVTDPDVADVQLLTPTTVLVQGKAVGSTDLLMWSQDEQVQQTRIDVQVDLGQLSETLAELFPLADLKLVQAQDVVIIEGQLQHADDALQLQAILDAAGLTYVDRTTVAGQQQVQLRVRIAEVSRSALRILGFNIMQTGTDAFGAVTVGSSGGGALNPISIGVPAATSAAAGSLPFEFTQAVNVTSSVTLFGGFPDAALEIFVQALAENEYLRILAEPNIVALSGQEASFLAGGEFPVPIVQGTTVGGGSTITVEYKEYGVRLNFKPTVLGDGRIRLHVAPEVSQLTNVGAVVIEGFQIPAVLTRRADTTLELNSGQTFAMAGLISRSDTGRNSRVPGLGDLPVLGALFRSAQYESNETDLVVMVTASFVEPLSTDEDLSDMMLPGSFHTPPNDWELYGLGRLEGAEPGRLSAKQSAWLNETGLSELRGPGAWATYDPPAPSQPVATVEPTVEAVGPTELVTEDALAVEAEIHSP